LVICHGVNSHGGRYKRPAEQFVNSGLAVYALDLRGRGKSEGERFYVENVADYAGDVAGTVQIAKERHPGPREQNETVATARAQALVRRALDDPATFTRLHAEGATLRDAEVAAVAFASDDA
jgi:pimeloyl-ACP methyl ester carboxylesterase